MFLFLWRTLLSLLTVKKNRGRRWKSKPNVQPEATRAPTAAEKARSTLQPAPPSPCRSPRGTPGIDAIRRRFPRLLPLKPRRESEVVHRLQRAFGPCRSFPIHRSPICYTRTNGGRIIGVPACRVGVSCLLPVRPVFRRLLLRLLRPCLRQRGRAGAFVSLVGRPRKGVEVTLLEW